MTARWVDVFLHQKVPQSHEILPAVTSQRQAVPRRPQREASVPKPLSSEGYFESWCSDSVIPEVLSETFTNSWLHFFTSLSAPPTQTFLSASQKLPQSPQRGRNTNQIISKGNHFTDPSFHRPVKASGPRRWRRHLPGLTLYCWRG